MGIQTVSIPPSPMPDMPLEAEQIIEGNPVSYGLIAMQSDDKTMTCGFWECTEGKFEWNYTWDEFVHVLEGQVIITEDGGDSHTLNPGDTARFSPGMKTFWHVTKPIKKMFTIRSPEPLEGF